MIALPAGKTLINCCHNLFICACSRFSFPVSSHHHVSVCLIYCHSGCLLTCFLSLFFPFFSATLSVALSFFLWERHETAAVNSKISPYFWKQAWEKGNYESGCWKISILFGLYNDICLWFIIILIYLTPGLDPAPHWPFSSSPFLVFRTYSNYCSYPGSYVVCVKRTRECLSLCVWMVA